MHWFVGYTPQLVAGVWVGYDDMRKSLAHGEAGGRVSAPIWAQFMKEALAKKEVQDFINLIQCRNLLNLMNLMNH